MRLIRPSHQQPSGGCHVLTNLTQEDKVTTPTLTKTWYLGSYIIPNIAAPLQYPDLLMWGTYYTYLLVLDVRSPRYVPGDEVGELRSGAVPYQRVEQPIPHHKDTMLGRAGTQGSISMHKDLPLDHLFLQQNSELTTSIVYLSKCRLSSYLHLRDL